MLAYADVRWLIVLSSFKVRWGTSSTHAVGSFDERISNGLFARCKTTVGYFYGVISPTKLWSLINKLLTYKKRNNNE